jgi:tRNA 2-selenouridine synthase
VQLCGRRGFCSYVDFGSRIRLVSPTALLDSASPPEFDMIVDVRAPCEFAEDRVPNSVNNPVLNDAERVEVGTLYQSSPFEARRLGSARIAGNISEILKNPAWAELPSSTRILVYCWRGGDRSLSLAHIASRIGYRTSLLDGGYRGYRREAKRQLEEPDGLLSRLQLVVVGGLTGTAKTLLLERLERAGGQVLNHPRHPALPTTPLTPHDSTRLHSPHHRHAGN